jgi:hypothetical protein
LLHPVKLAPEPDLAGARDAALDHAPGGVTVLVPGARGLVVHYANPAFRAAVPDPSQDPVGRTLDELWRDEGGLELRAMAEDTFRTGDEVRFAALEQPLRDGGRRFQRYHLCRVPVGGAPAVLLTLWDTTELEEARASAERERERAELVASLAADLNGGAGLDEVLRTALVRTAALLGAEDGSLWLLDDTGDGVRGAAEITPLGRTGARRPLADLPCAAAALRSRSARLFRREHATRAEGAYMARHGLAAALAVPLVERGEVRGLLYLNYRPLRFLPAPRDVAFAEVIAGQCALAVAREAWRAARVEERVAMAVDRDLRAPLETITRVSAALRGRAGIGLAARRGAARIATEAAAMERVLAAKLRRPRGGGDR